MFDLIGDIHGHASHLKKLLLRLGYELGEDCWFHPERKVIFLGDFIDRGPEQLEVIQIVQRMIECNQALAVMGNHELNAIAWTMECPEQNGEYLRPHTPKNHTQHASFLEQVGENSPLHNEVIAWFKTLPVYLDFDGLRVIHACWHEEAIDVLKPCLNSHNQVMDSHRWLEICS